MSTATSPAVAAAADGLSPELLDQARARALQDGVPLPAALQALGGWTAADFTALLGRSLGYPVLAMDGLLALSPRFDLVRFGDCSGQALLPAQDAAGTLHLVLGNPFDADAEAWAHRRLAAHGQVAARVAIAHADDLAACLARHERSLRALDGPEAPAGPDRAADGTEVISLSSIGEDESPVVRLVNSTLYDALKLGASDIHLECDAGWLHVQYRVDGVLMPVTSVPGQDMAEQVVSRIKVMAELDITERRVPQDGRFKVRVNDRDIDFRVSVMPSLFGEDAVLRLLDRQALTEHASTLRLDNLGLDAQTMRQIRRLAQRPHGMLLVTGPTGSGKTTTLYATITEIHTGRDKIVTIEDPVEYRLPRVLQIPVNEKKGLGFARGLRSILRHDPDKIMVGEIRDPETAQIAVQAALTGHLVLTTVHANSVFDVLGRMLHMAVDAYSFAAALNGIVAQRLVRLNCPACTADATVSDDELAEADLDRAQTAGWRLRAGRGCAQCRGSGYKGRKAVAEVLLLDDTLRELITTQAPLSRMKDEARRAGVRSVRDQALACVAAGETTLAEFKRVVG